MSQGLNARAVEWHTIHLSQIWSSGKRLRDAAPPWGLQNTPFFELFSCAVVHPGVIFSTPFISYYWTGGKTDLVFSAFDERGVLGDAHSRLFCRACLAVTSLGSASTSTASSTFRQGWDLQGVFDTWRVNILCKISQNLKGLNQ